MNLIDHWLEEKVQPHLKFTRGKLFAFVFLLALIFFFLGRSFNSNSSQSPQFNQNLPEVSLPRPGLGKLQASPSAKLKLLSSNLIGIYEEVKNQKNKQADANKPTATESAKQSPASSGPTTRLSGLRILGEYQNIGSKTAENIQAIVSFFDKNGILIAKKKAAETSLFRFQPAKPNEINLYDVTVVNPPQSEKLQIELTVQTNEKSSNRQTRALQVEYLSDLKIKDKNLKKQEIKKGNTPITYYKFTGKIINTGEKSLTNPLLYVYIKDKEGRVFAAAYKEFKYDILEKNDELEVILPVVPIKKEEMQTYEVRLWGEKL